MIPQAHSLTPDPLLEAKSKKEEDWGNLQFGVNFCTTLAKSKCTKY